MAQYVLTEMEKNHGEASVKTSCWPVPLLHIPKAGKAEIPMEYNHFW